MQINEEAAVTKSAKTHGIGDNSRAVAGGRFVMQQQQPKRSNAWYDEWIAQQKMGRQKRL